ncbi:hypothetical protein BZG36_03198 [Bifiguratus adelaidae]|uniref:DUF7137 domain-containing protein n=1 Tax=Bifiguratus adelaidae TaxID=1938954 RepID=A0A261Y181_9FUNG|nr:hypothetical protein BZG36_03198 [Bifiguratus adelaidae]
MLMRITISIWLAVLCLAQGISGARLEKRQATPVGATPSSTPSQNIPTPTPAPASGSTPVTAIATNSGSALPSGSGAATSNAPQSGGSGTNIAGLPTSASFGNSVQPGQVQWITPIPNQTFAPLAKMGANVTFSWTYTDLLVQPQNLTLQAVGPGTETWSVTAMPGLASSVVWNLANVPQTQPLVEGYYTMQLFDQRGPSAWPSGGWLEPNTRLTIGIYSPQPYQTSTSSGNCATCYTGSGSAGLSDLLMPYTFTFGIALLSSAVILRGMFQ